MRVVAFPNQSGARFWRLEHPFKYLKRLGVDARVADTGITEEIVQWGDVFVLQGCIDKSGIALLHAYQQEQGKFIVVDADDFPKVDDDSPFKREHEVGNSAEVFKATMEIADMITVTTKHLADKLEPINPNVKILPNYMDMEMWDIEPKLKNLTDTIRIGWAGSLTHMKDLEMVEKPLKRLMEAYPQVKLIFCGEMRIAELFKGYNVECFLGTPLNAWPSRLNGLRLDIGIAPLRDTEFNRCKSNIKFLEYAINKIPGVYSPTIYKFRDFDMNFGRIAETDEDWFRILENLVKNKILRDDISEHAYSYVRHTYDLSKHAKEWKTAYESLLT